MHLAPRTSHLVLSLLLMTTSLFSQTEPWCFNATAEDFQAAEAFENAHPTVASSLATEISIPLHIIYVNDDSGIPPENNFLISKQVIQANEVYEGFLNFYICGYHHVNSTNYTYFNKAEDKLGLYNTYHVDDAVNVYIVKSITAGNVGVNGLADFPFNTAPNNNIYLKYIAGPYILAHEFGHYLGLFHTFSDDYHNENNCFLKNPQTEDTDMVPDTPVDPGRTLLGQCVQECPIAITPCTLTCYNYTSTPVTYTYVGYYTNNFMSYHDCPIKVLTLGQRARMENHLYNSPYRTFLLNAQPTCNNNIAETGYVKKLCTASAQTLSTPVRGIIVDLKNNTTNWITSSNTYAQGIYEHFRHDFSNLVTSNSETEKNTHLGLDAFK